MEKLPLMELYVKKTSYISDVTLIRCLITTERLDDYPLYFNLDGTLYQAQGGECILFPSKYNRDWSTSKLHEKYGFKPFDKVLVRDCDSDILRFKIIWIEELINREL